MTVLLLAPERDASVLESLGRAFNSVGHKTEISHTNEAAIERLQTGDNIRLVLASYYDGLSFGNFDSQALIQASRNHTPPIPVVVMVSMAGIFDERVKVNFQESGIPIVTMPFDDLLEEIPGEPEDDSDLRSAIIKAGFQI